MTLFTHIQKTLKLAFPVILSRVGLLTIIAVDTIMVGRSGMHELAYYSLSAALQVPVLLVGIGMLLGTTVLTAQAEGADVPHEIGQIWRVASAAGFGLGILITILCLNTGFFLRLLQQPPELIDGAHQVGIMFGVGMPGLMLFTATIFMLEGIHRPLPGMWITLVANVLNFGLNYLFMFSDWQILNMSSAEGATLATSILRWLSFFALLIYVLVAIDGEKYGIRKSFHRNFVVIKRMLRIGSPLALTQGIESTAISGMTFLAGWISTEDIGAFQIAMNVISIIYMVAMGLGTAASIRVGNAVGRNDLVGLRIAAWVATLLVFLILLFLGILLFLFAGPVAEIFTNEQSLIPIAISTLIVAAIAIIPDGVQGVIMGALRGIADVLWPCIMFFIIFWVFMIPFAYWIGVTNNGGSPALMLSIGIGTLLASFALGGRFYFVTRNHINRL